MDVWPEFVTDDDPKLTHGRAAGPTGELTGWETVIFQLEEERPREWTTPREFRNG
jgi:hypothetical protein